MGSIIGFGRRARETYPRTSVGGPPSAFIYAAGSDISHTGTIPPNSSAQIAAFGISATKVGATTLLLCFGSFDVSTDAGEASLEVEVLVDGAPMSPPCVLYSGQTPVNPSDPVVYTTTLSGDNAYLFPDLNNHTFTVQARTGPNTTVSVRGASGTLRLFVNLSDFS